MTTFNPSCLAFKDVNQWAAKNSLSDSLGEKIPFERMILNHDYEASVGSVANLIPAHAYSYIWDSEMTASKVWAPQGFVQGQWATASGPQNYHIAAFDYKGANPQRGVLLHFTNYTRIAEQIVNYKKVLTVVLTGRDSNNKVKMESMNAHAGGLAVFANLLYVADTIYGLRVYDLNNVRRASKHANCASKIGWDAEANGYCAFGNEYILPEVNQYARTNASGTPITGAQPADADPRWGYVDAPVGCKVKLSWLGRDGASLLAGEFCHTVAGSTCEVEKGTSPNGTRMIRIPVNTTTGRLASTLQAPSKGFYTRVPYSQGAAPNLNTADPDDYYFSTCYSSGLGDSALVLSRPSSSAKVVYRKNTGNYFRLPQGITTTGTYLHTMNEGVPDFDNALEKRRVLILKTSMMQW